MTFNSTDLHEYQYDCLYQVTDANYPDSSTVAYDYDDLGNRTSVVASSTTSYASNDLNQYNSVGGTSYSYDNNGNLTGDGTYTYTYDCENRLTSATSPSVSYKYDFAGRRVKKHLAVDTWYCYDGDQVIVAYVDAQVQGLLEKGAQASRRCITMTAIGGRPYRRHSRERARATGARGRAWSVGACRSLRGRLRSLRRRGPTAAGGPVASRYR